MSGPIISQSEMTALLGRSLTENETENYESQLDIAKLRIEDLLCLKLESMEPLPSDLKLLLARCFEAISAEQIRIVNQGIEVKKVEDFSISYATDAKSPMVEFVRLNAQTIDKYGQCQGPIRSGKVICGCGF